jgi:hypothetical protein
MAVCNTKVQCFVLAFNSICSGVNASQLYVILHSNYVHRAVVVCLCSHNCILILIFMCASQAMSAMNKQMNLPALTKIMREFERQNERMDMTSEMMGDAMDDAFEVR